MQFVSKKWIAALALAPMTLLSGCGVLGFIAATAPPPSIEASYAGLEETETLVMVWMDEALEIDFPSATLDLSFALQTNLMQGAEADTPGLIGTTFPYTPPSVLKWQREHPETQYQSVEAFAPDLPVDRLVYVELTQLDTRAPASIALFLGTATASVYVVEITGTGADRTATTVFQDNEIRVQWPEEAPDTGRPDLSDRQVYVNTLRLLSDELAVRFVRRPGDAW
ncbi:MAG: hypothetical protein AAGD32_14395 [Planctomycetota bacterium]